MLQHCVFSLSAGTRWHTDGSITFKSLCSLICGKRFRKIKGEIVSYKQFLSTVTWGLQSSRLHIKSSYDTRLWDKRSLLLDDQQAWQQALLSGGVLRTPPSVSTRGSEGKNTHSGFHPSTWNHGDSHETVHVPHPPRLCWTVWTDTNIPSLVGASCAASLSTSSSAVIDQMCQPLSAAAGR